MSDGLELLESLSLPQVLPLVVNSLVSRVHTATVGRVESYDPSNQVADVTPLVNRVSNDGVVSKYKKLSSVPILFPGGTAGGLTFPVRRGDVGLLVFAERSTDEVLVSGNQETPGDPRSYHLADGFFIPGVLTGNKTSKVTNSDTTELSNGAARVILTSGRLALGVGTVEVLKLICDALQALISTTVMVAGVPVPLSSVATLTALYAQLELIRGEL